MQNRDISCKVSIDGKLLASSAISCHLSPHGQLHITFKKSVELIGTRRREFSTPSFALYPFTRFLLSTGINDSPPEAFLKMSGTDIGYWSVRRGPKSEETDSYRLKSAIVQTKFFRDGISLEIGANTELGVSAYEGRIQASDLPAITISISMFIPTSELGGFIMPDELRLLSFMEEKLSKLPTSST